MVGPGERGCACARRSQRVLRRRVPAPSGVRVGASLAEGPGCGHARLGTLSTAPSARAQPQARNHRLVLWNHDSPGAPRTRGCSRDGRGVTRLRRPPGLGGRHRRGGPAGPQRCSSLPPPRHAVLRRRAAERSGCLSLRRRLGGCALRRVGLVPALARRQLLHARGEAPEGPAHGVPGDRGAFFSHYLRAGGARAGAARHRGTGTAIQLSIAQASQSALGRARSRSCRRGPPRRPL